ncbi:MAG: hypothetical protein EBS32_11535, partial [Actinobacteria bacterium]|nr:hypothetical protein [Actinomycetota bacterium]
MALVQILQRVLTLSALSLSLICGAQAQTEWKFNNSYAPTRPESVQIRAFAADVEKRTGGKMKISVSEGGALGLKDADALYLATDEDREGEAISWHLLEYLKPRVPVHRMVFHEINKTAIQHALENPRGIDYGLVDAAETRRILDRLYGYEVSPVLWRRVNRGLSAGRVQSPALRLIVDRERERRAFRAADYFSLEAVTETERGYITYMRTDSTNLSDEAIADVRAHIRAEYGDRFVSDKVRTYANKSKNAQEAHEAIRPALPIRSPEKVAGELRGHELSLYTLIYQRTLASQMPNAAGTTVSVRLGATANDSNRTDCEFAASGTTIKFQGYRRAYEESTDEDDTPADDENALLLPPLTKGQPVDVREYGSTSHTTTPPARYTEASLVKELEA